MGLIYLDACFVIYLVERHPLWGDRVTRLLTEFAEEGFGISSLVKCECLVGPLKQGNPVLRDAYLAVFDRFVSLTIPEPAFLQAAELRARFGLRTPDALHLACAQHHGCAALWTNDDRLARASHGLARNMLD
ncbi:MAG TPA: type II toxin-antitoxin system VapC family toxin [Stellaceae bacterium]|nr:type II toxin-antitoxin system VapC family toxin [Stellaceae bacterium]